MAVKRHGVEWVLAAQDKASAVMATVENRLKSVSTAGERLEKTFQSAVLATGAAAFGTAMIKAASEAEQASNRMNAVLRATGLRAVHTREEMEDLAKSMQESVGFDDESVMNAQSALLKFGNIHGNVFREALTLSGDLAAFMGTNIPEAAQMIGKSLQSPTEGLTMMERQFGKLTEAEEKHIEALVKQGKAAEAQAAVLELWRNKVGGVAGEMNTGLLKSTRDVTNAWGDMLESFGRTGPVGDLVRRSLGGLKDLLNDIAGLAEGGAKSDPFRAHNLSLQRMNEEVETLERTLKLAGPEAGGKRVFMSEADQAAVRERIEALRAERRALLELTMAQREQAAMEASMQAANRKVELGGGPKDDGKAAAAAAQREAEFRAQKAVELQEMAATDSREAWEAYTKGRLAQEKEVRERQEAGMKAWFENIDREQEEAIEAGEAYLEAERAQADALKEKEELWRSLGFTMSSYFEKAVLQVRKWSDALEVGKALMMDVAQIAFRELVTKPIGIGVTEAVKGFGTGFSWDKLFGGGGGMAPGASVDELAFVPGRAAGGSVHGGRPYMVGEAGPELFVPRSSGAIVPNDALGGGRSEIHIHFTAGTPAAMRDAVYEMLPLISDAASGRTLAQLQAAGKL